MWPVLRALWNARRGRRAAVAAIAPLVARSRSRLDGIPEEAWHDPYIIGFMMMLITLTARRSVHITDSQTLGAVQAEAWTSITSMRVSAIGEETVHLSTAEHQAFEAGCRNAVAFDLALYGTSAAGVADAASHQADECEAELSGSAPSADGRERILALWHHYFESHLPASV
ncbi:MAG: hypothetical protein ACOY5F_17205 [Pseudomonadota bacterium]